ncbi:MAG: VOC family protein, partial [Tepidiformaceae bacterium]
GGEYRRHEMADTQRAQRLETVIQYCVDQEAAGRWYADFLGIETSPYPGPLFLLEGGGALFVAPGSPGTGRGGTAVCFAVADVDQAYRERIAQGITFNEEPYDVPTGRFVTALDPEGNIVALIEQRQPTP